MEEFKSLAGLSDTASESRKEELAGWLVEHKQGHEEEIDAFLQINDKAYKLIPWSYIAKEYFGKSVSWLTQRINGYSVRGKVYTLNEEQKATLNRALSEIGKFIGSYRVA